ncbi:MAG: 30S ribosomal protein S24e [Candidatus Nanoarchaeia archaeon]
MEIKILEKVENPLMNRVEIKAEITHVKEATPKRAEIRPELAKILNVNQEQIVIQNIKPKFGFKAICNARYYSNKESLEKFEPKYILGRERGQKLKPHKKEATNAKT